MYAGAEVRSLEDTAEGPVGGLLQSSRAIAGAETIAAEADPIRDTVVSARTWRSDQGTSTLQLGDEEGEGERLPSERLPSGFVLGRYRIVEVIGSGGMGVVYRAYDPELDRWLAIKVLRDERKARRDKVRFLREAQAMARLSHPNVVPVHDVGSGGLSRLVLKSFSIYEL